MKPKTIWWAKDNSFEADFITCGLYEDGFDRFYKNIQTLPWLIEVIQKFLDFLVQILKESIFIIHVFMKLLVNTRGLHDIPVFHI